MEGYKNLGGRSGIESYKIGSDYIFIKFKKSSEIYTYTYKLTGENEVEEMKGLAVKGEGLNTYVNKHKGLKFIRGTL